MTPQDLIAAFESVAEAPDGVARLRELVLQLAVRGRLVPQDDGDEPATELLQRVAAEKAKLVMEKKIRKPKALPPVSADDVPFDVPDGWAWVRMDDLLQFVTSGSRGWAKYYSDDGPVFLRIGNLDYDTTDLDLANIQRVSPPEGAEGSRTAVAAGDFLISITGDTGMVGLVPDGLGRAFINQHIALCRPLSGVWPAFVARVCTSLLVRDQLWDYQRGIKNSLGLNDIRVLLLPLPPLAEQHRIVARVDELMGLLDRLEAARDSREATRVALRDAALAALRDADSAEEVEVAWQRIAERMDDLFTDPADVEPLRQTVLQLAVRGRLVPQDERDEPASEVLERIAAEQARQVQEGTIRKPKLFDSVLEEETRFALPAGWCWTRFQNVTEIGAGITKGRNLTGRATAPCPYLRVANVQAGYLNLDVLKTIDVPLDEVARYALLPGDVLLTEGGDWDKLGRSAIWSGELPECLHQNHVFRARPLLPGSVGARWLSMFTNSPDGREYFQSCAKQTTNLASINKTQLRACPIPIPPEAEQERILAKVDELMGLLDRLEQGLASTRTSHGAFAAAALHHLDP